MPFDAPTETPAIRRSRLASELRSRDFPDWDFADARHCAIPVAIELYGRNFGETTIGLTRRQYSRIFGVWAVTFGFSFFYGCHASHVTPAMVADALETLG